MCFSCVSVFCRLRNQDWSLVFFSSTVTCEWLPITVTVSSSSWRWTYSPRDCVHATSWYLRSFFWSARCETSEGQLTWWLFEPWNFGPKWTSGLPQELKDASNWQLKLFKMGETKGGKSEKMIYLRYFLAWDTLLQKSTQLLLMFLSFIGCSSARLFLGDQLIIHSPVIEHSYELWVSEYLSFVLKAQCVTLTGIYWHQMEFQLCKVTKNT